jgi:hypothetical protein
MVGLAARSVSQDTGDVAYGTTNGLTAAEDQLWSPDTLGIPAGDTSQFGLSLVAS